MPVIQLSLSNGRKFHFSSYDYFIYPTHTEATEQIQSLWGLSSWFNDKDYNVESNNNASTFVFGQLFVQTYDIQLNYELMPNNSV